jgi:hypothetical protein
MGPEVFCEPNGKIHIECVDATVLRSPGGGQQHEIQHRSSVRACGIGWAAGIYFVLNHQLFARSLQALRPEITE